MTTTYVTYAGNRWRVLQTVTDPVDGEMQELVHRFWYVNDLANRRAFDRDPDAARVEALYSLSYS